MSFDDILVHEIVEKAYTSGEDYDSSRPTYTEKTTEFVLNKCNFSLEGIYDILELGAGTGIFTRKIIDNSKQKLKLLATDPLEHFLLQLKCQSPDIETLQCSAESIPLPDNSVKNIVCAQCLHWFANTKALTEMHRVLAPNGMIVFLWNRISTTDPSTVTHALHTYIMTLYGDTPNQHNNAWVAVFDNYNAFTPVQSHTFDDHFRQNGQDFIVGYLMSISVIAKLDESEKETVREMLDSILNTHPESKSNDTVQIIFDTSIHWCSKVTESDSSGRND